ncbi:MAG: zf-HC2 domain-containing protein [Burkholderiales bacterium]
MRLVPSCREVSELLSQAQDRPLGVREKLALYVHLPLCNGCRNFKKQLAFIRQALKELVRTDHIQ